MDRAVSASFAECRTALATLSGEKSTAKGTAEAAAKLKIWLENPDNRHALRGGGALTWDDVLSGLATCLAGLKSSSYSKPKVAHIRDAFLLYHQCVVASAGPSAQWEGEVAPLFHAVTSFITACDVWEALLPLPFDVLRVLFGCREAMLRLCASPQDKGVASLVQALLSRASAVAAEKASPSRSRHLSACTTELMGLFAVLEVLFGDFPVEIPHSYGGRAVMKPAVSLKKLAEQACDLFPLVDKDNRKEFCECVKMLNAVVRARGCTAFHSLCVCSEAVLTLVLHGLGGKPDRQSTHLLDFLLLWVDISTQTALYDAAAGTEMPVSGLGRPLTRRLHPEDVLAKRLPELAQALLCQHMVDSVAGISTADSGMQEFAAAYHTLAATVVVLSSPELQSVEDRMLGDVAEVVDVSEDAGDRRAGPTLWQHLVSAVTRRGVWEADLVLSHPLGATISAVSRSKVPVTTTTVGTRPDASSSRVSAAPAYCTLLRVYGAVLRVHPAAASLRSDLAAIMSCAVTELCKARATSEATHDALLDVVASGLDACVAAHACLAQTIAAGRDAEQDVAAIASGLSAEPPDSRRGSLSALVDTIGRVKARRGYVQAEQTAMGALWKSVLSSLVEKVLPFFLSLHGCRADGLGQKALGLVARIVAAGLSDPSVLVALQGHVWKLACFYDSFLVREAPRVAFSRESVPAVGASDHDTPAGLTAGVWWFPFPSIRKVEPVMGCSHGELLLARGVLARGHCVEGEDGVDVSWLTAGGDLPSDSVLAGLDAPAAPALGLASNRRMMRLAAFFLYWLKQSLRKAEVEGGAMRTWADCVSRLLCGVESPFGTDAIGWDASKACVTQLMSGACAARVPSVLASVLSKAEASSVVRLATRLFGAAKGDLTPSPGDAGKACRLFYGLQTVVAALPVAEVEALNDLYRLQARLLVLVGDCLDSGGGSVTALTCALRVCVHALFHSPGVGQLDLLFLALRRLWCSCMCALGNAADCASDIVQSAMTERRKLRARCMQQYSSREDPIPAAGDVGSVSPARPLPRAKASKRRRSVDADAEEEVVVVAAPGPEGGRKVPRVARTQLSFDDDSEGESAPVRSQPSSQPTASPARFGSEAPENTRAGVFVLADILGLLVISWQSHSLPWPADSLTLEEDTPALLQEVVGLPSWGWSGMPELFGVLRVLAFVVLHKHEGAADDTAATAAPVAAVIARIVGLGVGASEGHRLRCLSLLEDILAVVPTHPVEWFPWQVPGEVGRYAGGRAVLSSHLPPGAAIGAFLRHCLEDRPREGQLIANIRLRLAFLDTLQPWLSACPPDVLDKEMGQFIGGMGFQAKLEAFLRLGCTAVDRLCRQRSAACLATLTDLYELSKDSYTALLLPVEGKVPEGIGGVDGLQRDCLYSSVLGLEEFGRKRWVVSGPAVVKLLLHCSGPLSRLRDEALERLQLLHGFANMNDFLRSFIPLLFAECLRSGAELGCLPHHTLGYASLPDLLKSQLPALCLQAVLVAVPTSGDDDDDSAPSSLEALAACARALGVPTPPPELLNLCVGYIVGHVAALVVIDPPTAPRVEAVFLKLLRVRKLELAGKRALQQCVCRVVDLLCWDNQTAGEYGAYDVGAADKAVELIQDKYCDSAVSNVVAEARPVHTLVHLASIGFRFPTSHRRRVAAAFAWLISKLNSHVLEPGTFLIAIKIALGGMCEKAAGHDFDVSQSYLEAVAQLLRRVTARVSSRPASWEGTEPDGQLDREAFCGIAAPLIAVVVRLAVVDALRSSGDRLSRLSQQCCGVLSTVMQLVGGMSEARSLACLLHPSDDLRELVRAEEHRFGDDDDLSGLDALSGELRRLQDAHLGVFPSQRGSPESLMLACDVVRTHCASYPLCWSTAHSDAQGDVGLVTITGLVHRSALLFLHTTASALRGARSGVASVSDATRAVQSVCPILRRLSQTAVARPAVELLALLLGMFGESTVGPDDSFCSWTHPSGHSAQAPEQRAEVALSDPLPFCYARLFSALGHCMTALAPAPLLPVCTAVALDAVEFNEGSQALRLLPRGHLVLISEFIKKPDRSSSKVPVDIVLSFRRSLWSWEHTGFTAWLAATSSVLATALAGDAMLPLFARIGVRSVGYASELFHASILVSLWKEGQGMLGARAARHQDEHLSCCLGDRGPTSEVGCVFPLSPQASTRGGAARPCTANGPIRKALSEEFSAIFRAAAARQGQPDGCLEDVALLLLDTLAILRAARSELFSIGDPARLCPYLCLKLDYGVIASACLALARPMSAVLYSELLCSVGQNQPVLRSRGVAGPTSDAMGVLATFDESNPDVDALLTAQCQLIDPDGPEGVSVEAATTASRVQVAVHSSEAERALVLSSGLLTQGDAANRERNVAWTAWALQTLGAYPALAAVLSTAAGPEGPSSDRLCETAWKCGSWDALDRSDPSVRQCGPNDSLLRALSCIVSKDDAGFRGHIARARDSCITAVRAVSWHEPSLTWQTGLNAFLSVDSVATRARVEMLDEEHASVPFQLCSHNRAMGEAVLSSRLAVLRAIRQRRGPRQPTRAVDIWDLRAVLKFARLTGVVAIAASVCEELRALQPRVSDVDSPAGMDLLHAVCMSRVEEAKFLWQDGCSSRALRGVQAVEGLLCTLPLYVGEAKPLVASLSRCLRLCGSWLAASGADSTITLHGRDVFAEAIALWDRGHVASLSDVRQAVIGTGDSHRSASWFLQKALEVASSCPVDVAIPEDSSVHLQGLKAHLALGRLADEVYSTLVTRTSSPEWAHFEVLRKRKNDELEAFKAQYDRSRSDQVIGGVSGGELRRYHALLSQKVAEDNARAASTVTSMNQHLIVALSHYGHYLHRLSPAGDAKGAGLHTVFRIVALWFKHSSDAQVNALMSKVVEHVSPHIFLPLVYQIVSRLTVPVAPRPEEAALASPRTPFSPPPLPLRGKRALEKPPTPAPMALSSPSVAPRSLPRAPGLSASFQDVLFSLVHKLGCRHPHGTLVQLIALENGRRDKAACDPAKVAAAETMLREVSCSSPALATTVTALRRLSDAYLALGYFPISKESRSAPALLSSVPVSGVSQDRRDPSFASLFNRTDQRKADVMRYMPIMTLSDTSGHWGGEGDAMPPVSVFKFEDSFKIASSGVSLPKILTCIGSDGKKYTQLVKAKDDLRLDAVMQQLFGVVNQLLSHDDEARTRSLSIRTYKVVPLAPRAGIIEWVANARSLGDCLVTPPTGAHVRHNKGDWTPAQCRKRMDQAKVERDIRKKRDMFDEVCAHFRPAMHFFLLEQFLNPAMWYYKRLAFSRSVAVANVVGYTVGIGDRHPQNVMLDCTTAEVIHIDFGVAFDQGRLLPTPELIPFRLTRDFVAGMGVSGVNGPYSRCSEVAMSVLRAHMAALLVVVEVFLHDPLYDWALSPVKQMAMQDAGDPLGQSGSVSVAPHSVVVEDIPFAATAAPMLMEGGDQSARGKLGDAGGNEDAMRVLVRIRHKLQGCEHADGKFLSVPAQIKRLVAEAQDPDKLCLLYPGWQAWV